MKFNKIFFKFFLIILSILILVSPPGGKNE